MRLGVADNIWTALEPRGIGAMSTRAHLASLVKAFADRHGCNATHMNAVAVEEVQQKKVIWAGEVEVFALKGHPKAKVGYAWGFDEKERKEIVTVLELPPVTSPQQAVKAAIVAELKKKKPKTRVLNLTREETLASRSAGPEMTDEEAYRQTQRIMRSAAREALGLPKKARVYLTAFDEGTS
jgi:hypothetical protein